jgi:hypothetical protein
MWADEPQAERETLTATTEGSGETMKSQARTVTTDRGRNQEGALRCATLSRTTEEAGDEPEDRTGKIRLGGGR